jgi:hypothetical protein
MQARRGASCGRQKQIMCWDGLDKRNPTWPGCLAGTTLTSFSPSGEAEVITRLSSRREASPPAFGHRVLSKMVANCSKSLSSRGVARVGGLQMHPGCFSLTFERAGQCTPHIARTTERGTMISSRTMMLSALVLGALATAQGRMTRTEIKLSEAASRMLLSAGDHTYKVHEKVPLYANKVGPFHNPSEVRSSAVVVAPTAHTPVTVQRYLRLRGRL